MTNPELDVTPRESNRALFVDFVQRTAKTQTDEGVKYGSEPHTDTACVLVAKVDDTGREADQFLVDSEFRSLFPVLYTLSVVRVEDSVPDVEVAPMTLSDGDRGFVVIREDGKELIEEDGLRPDMVEDIACDFMIRNGIFHHIKQTS